MLNSSPHSRAWVVPVALTALIALVTAGECPMDETGPVDGVVSQEPNGEPESNGCGPASIAIGEEGSPLFTFLNCNLAPNGSVYCFTPACNNHDICYGTCHESLNLSREAHKASCEQAFMSSLNAICDETYLLDPISHVRCRATAFIYYSLTNNFGDASYSAAQDQECGGDAAATKLSEGDAEIAPSRFSSQEAPFEDQDGDLLPDDWEIEVGLDPFDATDAMLDLDGDGLINLLEFANALDPFDPDTHASGIGDLGVVLRAQR